MVPYYKDQVGSCHSQGTAEIECQRILAEHFEKEACQKNRDGMCRDADARWLYDRLSASPMRRDIKIGRATHLMHLEENRFALYRETEAFLLEDDREE